MSKTATITVTLKYVGDGEDRYVAYGHTNTTASLGVSVDGVQGFNGPFDSSVVPSPPLGYLYLPPVSNSGIPSASQVVKNLVQVGADVGIPLDPAAPQVFSAPAFGLNLSAPERITAKAF